MRSSIAVEASLPAHAQSESEDVNRAKLSHKWFWAGHDFSRAAKRRET
jgi:hypothetical protein